MSRLADTLLQKAQQQTGLSDFGDDWFMESLEAYLSGLDGPQISAFGSEFLARQAVKDLSRRLAIIDCLKRNPAIEETPIPPILYITGHERSGTTLLHNLLALHSGARYLSRWELMLPTPPPEAASFHEDPRRLEVKKSIDALRGSDLEKMHWVEADDPEECVWGFMDCTGIVGMAPSLVLPRWSEWLATADLTPSFINYRKIIQLLTWKNPVPDGGFLVLKAPQIASHLDNFSRVFPEATFLYLHRDPFRVLTSFCTLLDIVNGPFLKDQNYQAKLNQDESFCLKRMGKAYAKMAEFEAAHPQQVRNIQYVDLLKSPVDEIVSVYRELDFVPDVGLPQKIQEFLARQKAGGRARPRQEMTAHGYTREQVESDPALASYLKHYEVVLEPTRNTGVI
jgi:hypothetical protein